MIFSIFDQDSGLGAAATKRRVSITANGIYFTAISSPADWRAVAQRAADALAADGWEVIDMRVSDATYFVRLNLVANVYSNFTLRDCELSFKSTLERNNLWTIANVVATSGSPAASVATPAPPRPLVLAPNAPAAGNSPAPNAAPLVGKGWAEWLSANSMIAVVGVLGLILITKRRND